MKIFRAFSRILFVFLVILTAAALALYVYGIVRVSGEELSIITSIDMLIGIVDTDSDATFNVIYNSVVGAFIGLAYIVMLIVLVKKVIRMLKYVRKIFSKTDYDDFAKNFRHAVEINISVFFCILIFMFIALTSLEVVLCEIVTYIFLINFIIVAISVFFNSKFLTSTIKDGSTQYSIFNAIRIFIMTLGAALALDYIASSNLMTIIYNINTIALIDGDFGGSGRYNLYCYYSFLIEPIIILIATVVVIRLLNKIAKNQDNSVADYNYAANSLLHILVFSLVMMIIRIIIVVYCGSTDIELNWSAKLIKHIFGLIEYDLVPFALILCGLMILNKGMPAIEYNGKRKAKELYK